MFNAPDSHLILHSETFWHILNGGKPLEKDEQNQKLPDVDVQVKPGLGPTTLSLEVR